MPESALGRGGGTSGRVVSRVRLCGGAMNLAFGPRGRRLAAIVDADLQILVLDPRTGDVLRRLAGQHGTNMHGPGALSFSPDGKRLLATALEQTSLRDWDLAGGREAGRIDDHQDEPTAVAFSPDGRTMASVGLDGLVRVAAVSSGKVLHRMFRDEELFAVAFAPDGRTIAVGDQNNELSLWDATTGAHAATADDVGEGGIWGLSFAPDGQSLAVAGYASHVELWALRPPRLRRRIAFPRAQCPAVAFSRDGQRLVVGCGAQGIRVVDVQTAAPGKRLPVCGQSPAARRPGG